MINKPCLQDSTSIQQAPEDYNTSLNGNIKGMKIGVPYDLLDGINAEIKACCESFLEVLRNRGAEIVPITLPHNKYSVPVYYILAPAEASTNLARFDGIRYTKRSAAAKTLEQAYVLSRTEGFGPEVVNRILLGTYVLSAGYQDAYYRKAQKVRSLICSDYDAAFKQCEAIVFPTTAIPAFKHGSITDPIAMYKQDIFTISANMAGLPALSVPAGFTNDGLPIGIQVQAQQMNDALVMNIAKAFELETEHFSKIPASCGESK